MFTLTRRMILTALLNTTIAAGALIAMHHFEESHSFLGIMLPLVVFILLISAIREYSIRREDPRHHRASLEFSYYTTAMVVSVPLFILLAFTLWAEKDGYIIGLLVALPVIFIMNWRRARKRLKDHKPEDVFEARTPPAWTSRWPFRQPWMTFGLYTAIATVMGLGTAAVLGSSTGDPGSIVNALLILLVADTFLAAPLLGLSQGQPESKPVLPYLYAGVNGAVLLLGQWLFLQGTIYGDPQHPAAVVYFWVLLLSVTLPFMYAQRNGKPLLRRDKVFG